MEFPAAVAGKLTGGAREHPQRPGDPIACIRGWLGGLRYFGRKNPVCDRQIGGTGGGRWYRACRHRVRPVRDAALRRPGNRKAPPPVRGGPGRGFSVLWAATACR